MAGRQDDGLWLRRIIREEIARDKNTRGPPAANQIFSRAHELIDRTAEAAVNDFSFTAAAQSTASRTAALVSASAISPSPSYGFNASRRGAGRGRSRSSPGHPYRYSSKSRTTKKDVEKPHKSVNVWLLDVFIEDDDGKCPFEKCDDILFDEDMVIMKGYVMMNPLERDEFPIKMILCDLFQQRFTNIGPDDFGYLKRERNKLSLPKTGDGFVWNFENLKVLAGQGKLYCYIKESYKKLVDQPSPVDVNDEEITRSCDDSPSFPASSIVNKKHKSSTVVSDDELPSGSG